MSYIQAVNRFLDRWMILATPLAMVAGWRWHDALLPFVPASVWLFALSTLALSFGTSWGDLRRAVSRPLPVLTALALLHLVAPFFSWLAWRGLFPGNPTIGAGLVLAAAIPVGVSSLLWVNLAGGDLPLALTLVAIDTLLSPVILPFVVHLFVGQAVQVAVGSFIGGLLKMVMLPTLAGVMCHDLTGDRLLSRFAPQVQLTAKVTMILAVLLSVASSAARLSGFNRHDLPVFLILVALSALGYLSGYAAARLFRWEKPVAVSLAYCTGFRNTVAGTVIAAAYFPPRVALIVCLMMLFQQPLAGLVHHFATAGARQRVSQAA
ncbi:MAG: bile acid:sodium symporter family protein [Betaproteobacteria bacterium]